MPNPRRLGEGTRTEADAIVFPVRLEAPDDMTVGEIEIERDGDLASRPSALRTSHFPDPTPTRRQPQPTVTGSTPCARNRPEEPS